MAMPLLPILLMAQILPDQVQPPPPLLEQRADLALRRAVDGRAMARRFLCDDPSRLRRLREVDERFARIQNLFATRFGHGWRSGAEPDADLTDRRPNDLGRRDDCRLRDSFVAGLTEYENGLLSARAQLDGVGGGGLSD